MSAQNSPRRGLFTAILGTLGFSALAGVLVAVMVTPAIAVTGITANSTINIFDELPDFIEIDQLAQQNIIYAMTGATLENGEPEYTKIAEIYSQNREEVAWDEVSQYLKDAAISGEDRRFYEHGGVDLAGITRAVVNNLLPGDTQGASTITQQLVKNLFIMKAIEDHDDLDDQKAAIAAAQEVSLERKLREMKYAISLEKQYSKDQILLAYLNISGFGGNTYGVQAAAEQYYNTTAADVTIAQAASLIAIVQQPGNRNLNDPANYERNLERRNHILGAMLEEGNITKAEYAEAKATPVDETTVTLTPPQNGCIAAEAHSKWFCDFVEKNVKNLKSLGTDENDRKANWQKGGYKLYTTLHLPLQQNAQAQSWAIVPNNETGMQLGSATVSVEAGTGRILIMAQNKEFNASETGGGATTTAVNYNTDKAYGGSSGFQAGSIYKAFTLLDWLAKGYGLNEIVDATPRTVNLSTFTNSCESPAGSPWKFRNDATETGPWTVKRATARSVNGAFISMAQRLDLCDIRKTAEALGVHRADGAQLQSNPSAVLGTNEIAPMTLAAAYAAIANGGVYCEPYVVESIVGPDGEELAGQEQMCEQAIEAEVANTAAFAMQDVMTSGGTATAGNPFDGTPLLGKTGTTDKAWHTWLVGASTRVATAVWVGNIVGKQNLRSYYTIHRQQASILRHHVWRNTMGPVNAAFPGAAFPEPAPRLLTGTGVTVPDLTGATVASATIQLEAAGFRVTVGGVVESNQPEGTVAATSPGAGALLARGSEVTILTSDGAVSGVPDVVGDGSNTYADAVGILNSAGFNNVSEQCQVLEPADPLKEGMVISSDPSAGASVSKNRQIKVTVGKLVC